MGVEDPLLEVIIHWLKGERNIALSWDVIVGTLRDPSVNESELADKICLLYCERKEEQEDVGVGDETYSGK